MDAGSGTLDMGARRFSAGIGRFMQRDQFSGALSDLKLGLDPLTQNRYALAGGNPVSFIGGDGHLAADQAWADEFAQVHGSDPAPSAP